MYKTIYSFFIILIFLLVARVMPVMATEEEKQFESSGGINMGVQQIKDDGTNSSKFNEYRDIKDGFYLYKLNMDGVDTQTGRYFEFRGTDVNRTDQNLKLRVGGYGTWGLEIEWDEIPRLLSNKAKTLYNYQGGGLYTVPANAGITSIKTASLSQDTLVSNSLNLLLHPTNLGIQREKGRVALLYTPASTLKFRLEYSDERKEGTMVTGATIGDRPPRTLNVQLPELVDYQTRDLKFEAEYTRDIAQVQFSYLLSTFKNEVKSLTWKSMFYGNDADGSTLYNNDIERSVSTYGRTALYPDNKYQNATLLLGFNLPLESRLTTAVSRGWMNQDDDLLPYSYSSLTKTGTEDWSSLSNKYLPKIKAGAEIQTTLLNVNYTINPINRLNLQALYRYYDLDNKTPIDQWNYVTQDAAQDTSGNNNSNSVVGAGISKRKNVAYAYNKQNYGMDAYYNIWRTTFGTGYEREKIKRKYREADTGENIYKVSISPRLANWLSLKVKYLYGNREADNYNYGSTKQSYYYTSSEYKGTKDNPLFNFSNTPDLRKYDVSDRKRNQWDASILLKPLNTLDFNLSNMYRKDDFESGVSPTTMRGYNGSTSAYTNYNTLGRQLGLLEEKTGIYTVGANYAPTERLTFSANYSREERKSKERGISATEDTKYSGASWSGSDSDKVWEASITDKTDAFGIGAGLIIIPKKLNFALDYAYSPGTIDINYSGRGSDKVLNSNTYYYAFSDPESVSIKKYTLNTSLKYKMSKGCIVGLNYLFDKYNIKDWMQEPSGGWVDQTAGSGEYLLRDASLDNRWGNRLVSLGGTLAPSYKNHVVMITLAYKW